MDALPVDISTNILSRLPVKSVFQCRSVCKTWRSVIDNPVFANIHFIFSSLAPQNIDDHSSFIVVPKEQGHEMCILQDYQGSNGLMVKSSSRIRLPFSKDCYLRMIGSSNGLICFGNYDRSIYVCNPATREHVTVPVLNYGGCSISAGFGFVPSTKEFKVLQIFSWRQEDHIWKSEAYVCTVGSNSWRMTGNAPFDPLHTGSLIACFNRSLYGIGSSMACFNGSLYGIAFDTQRGIGANSYIVSFDLECETFAAIPSPHFTFNLWSHTGTFHPQFHFGMLRGCLYLTDCSLEDQNEIWVLNECDGNQSWSKQFVLKGDLCAGFISPICLRKNGELLLLHNSRFLVSYNHENEQVTQIQDVDLLFKAGYSRIFKEAAQLLFLGRKIPTECEAFPYFGSLISPKSIYKQANQLKKRCGKEEK